VTDIFLAFYPLRGFAMILDESLSEHYTSISVSVPGTDLLDKPWLYKNILKTTYYTEAQLS
jgi:hypothetical protein